MSEDAKQQAVELMAAMHKSAKFYDESLTHVIGGKAYQAKRHGSQVWFYEDGKRVARDSVEAHMSSGIEEDAAIDDLFGDGSQMEHRPNVGTVGHRDLLIIDPELTLPPGKYDAFFAGFDGKQFDVVVIDDLRTLEYKNVDAAARRVKLCFDGIGRAGIRPYQQAAIDDVRASLRNAVRPDKSKPKRNHGPRNRWGKLV